MSKSFKNIYSATCLFTEFTKDEAPKKVSGLSLKAKPIHKSHKTRPGDFMPGDGRFLTKSYNGLTHEVSNYISNVN